MNYKRFGKKVLELKHSAPLFLLKTLAIYTILILKIFKPKLSIHLISSSSFTFGNLFERDLPKNLSRDISIDATCTLPYVSRSCYVLIAEVKKIEPISQLRNGNVI
jgi:hypothetical protein